LKNHPSYDGVMLAPNCLGGTLGNRVCADTTMPAMSAAAAASLKAEVSSLKGSPTSTRSQRANLKLPSGLQKLET
jgi:hypothetical protein